MRQKRTFNLGLIKFENIEICELTKTSTSQAKYIRAMFSLRCIHLRFSYTIACPWLRDPVL